MPKAKGLDRGEDIDMPSFQDSFRSFLTQGVPPQPGSLVAFKISGKLSRQEAFTSQEAELVGIFLDQSEGTSSAPSQRERHQLLQLSGKTVSGVNLAKPVGSAQGAFQSPKVEGTFHDPGRFAAPKVERSVSGPGAFLTPKVERSLSPAPGSFQSPKVERTLAGRGAFLTPKVERTVGSTAALRAQVRQLVMSIARS